MPVPNRGEVWIVDLGMVGKVRPGEVTRNQADTANTQEYWK
jgi:hypothetical protein